MADEPSPPPDPPPPPPPVDTVQMYNRDGAPVQVRAADAAAIYRSGEATFAADEPVIVRRSDGTQHAVSGDEAARIASQGSLLEDFVDRKSAYDKIEKDVSESPLGLAHAGLAGVARGLTLGGSDVLISNGLVPSVTGVLDGRLELADANAQRASLERAQRYNPGVGLAGEAAAIGLSAIPTGGAGLFAKGAQGARELGTAARLFEGVTAAPRAVSAFGRGAERFAVDAAAGAGLAREGVAAKAIGAAAQGAAEGTVYGIANEAANAAIQDKDLTAESVLAAGGHGALLGGAAGTALSLFGSAARAASRKGYDTIEGLFTRSAPEADAAASAAIEAGAAPRLTDRTAEGYIRAIAGDDAGEAAALRDAWKRRSSLAHDSEAILEDSQRAIRRDVDELLESERALTQEAQGKLKRAHVEDAIRTGNEEAVADFAGTTTATLRKEIGEMLADPGAFGQVANLKTAAKVLDHVEGEIAGAIGTPASNAAAFVELDWLKRRLGKFAKPGQFLGADAATAQRFREMYEGLRGALENEDLWGKAAAQQREINAAWTKQLGSKDLFQSRFATKVGRDEIDPWLDKMGVDPTKVAGYVNGFGGAANDLAHETLSSHVANTKKLVETIGGAYEVRPEELAKAAKAVERFEGTLKKVESEVGAVNRLRKLKEAEGQGLGGVAGVVTDIASRPVATLGRLAVIEQAVANVQKRIGTGVTSFLETATSKVPTRISNIGAIAPHLSERHAEKTREKEFDDRRNEVARFLANPAPHTAALAELPAGLGDHIAADATRRAKYVADRIPQGLANPAFPSSKPTMPSPAEQAKWNRIARAVENPLSVLDDMKDGRLSQEAVDALKATSPILFAKVQQEVLAQIATMKTPPPYAKRVQLSTLLGVPADPTMQPDVLAALNAVGDPTKPKGAASPPRKPVAGPSVAPATESHPY